MRQEFVRICLSTLVLVVSSQVVSAIVLHPGGEPDANWTGRPHNDVIGRWGTNASCVVVGPNYIITTRHQTNDDNDVLSIPVVIGGVSYTINEFFTHPTADLRLVKLNHANFTEYVSVNFDVDEVEQVAVLGGYGTSRGATQGYYDDLRAFCPYGYLWLYPTSPIPANGILGWGTNEIVSISSTTSGYISDLIVSQFDVPFATDYECTLGMYDSGGGWFVHDAGGWRVVGLSRGVIRSGSVVFYMYPNSNPISTYPNPMMGSIRLNHLDAVRVGSYASWIASNMVAGCDQYSQADLSENCIVDVGDLALLVADWLREDCGASNNYCELSDLYRDGKVNLRDFAVLADQWLDDLN